MSVKGRATKARRDIDRANKRTDPCFGEVSVAGNSTAVTVATGATYVVLDELDAVGPYRGVTPGAGAITIKEKGTYRVECGMELASGTGTINVTVGILKNGTVQAKSKRVLTSVTQDAVNHVSLPPVLVECVPGDVIAVGAIHSDAGDVDLTPNGTLVVDQIMGSVE